MLNNLSLSHNAFANAAVAVANDAGSALPALPSLNAAANPLAELFAAERFLADNGLAGQKVEPRRNHMTISDKEARRARDKRRRKARIAARRLKRSRG